MFQCGPADGISDVWALLHAWKLLACNNWLFPAVLHWPLWPKDCPLHIHFPPSICTSGFPVFWEQQIPQISQSWWYGVIQTLSWSFKNWIKEICCFPSPKCLGRHLYVKFVFFCTNSKVILYLWSRAWNLRRNLGGSTRTPHREDSRSISGDWKVFVASTSPSVERKSSIWGLGLKIKVS